MHIGDKIKKLRLERKMKQSDLAEKSHVSRVAIGNYERGERQPTIDIVAKIAAALSVPISDLTNWADMDGRISEDEKLANEVKAIEAVHFSFGKKAVTILEDFASLNETGKDKAIEYVSDLAEQEKYLKPLD